MPELKDQIVAELEDKFSRHPVWIWYDSQEKYQGILDRVADELSGVHFVRYDGSYLELKRKIRDEDPDLEEKWLFYIPESRNDAVWFRDIHALGRQYRVGTRIDDEPVSQYLVEHEDEIPARYEDWGEDRDQRRYAFFSVLFDTSEPDAGQWLRTFLSAPDEYAATVREFDMEGAWEALLRERFGVDAGLDAGELARQLLFGEVAADHVTNRYDELAAADPQAAAEFCRVWRGAAPTVFRRYSTAIGEEYDMKNTVSEAGSFNWRAEAFPGIDEGLIELVMRRLAKAEFANLPERAGQLYEQVKGRENGFWCEEDIVDWSVPVMALEVLRKIEGADLDGLDNRSADDLVKAYTAEDGWWKIDARYREYVQAARTATYPYPKVVAVKDRVTRHYMAFLRTVNRPLAETIDQASKLGSPQTGFADAHLSPEAGRVVIICDGLRYELAQVIQQNIKHRLDLDADLSCLSAALPSITEVGMSAHLPGDLSLSLRGDGLTVQVDGVDTCRKADRVKILREKGYEVSDLDDINSVGLEKLKASETVPRVVYSGTIDKLGESLDDDEALSQVISHINAVERAVFRLNRAGYSEFIITSDHGFLHTQGLEDRDKVDPPHGARVTKRRFAVAENEAPTPESDEYIEIDEDALGDLGISAQGLRLFFPRSVACFSKRGGNMQYFHGGISLQELLVPCLTFQTSTQEDPAEVTYEVSIPDPVTNSIVSVDIQARTEQLSLDPSPLLEIRALIDGEPVADPVQLNVTPGENSARIRLDQGKISGASVVDFRVIDTDTQEVLDDQTVGLDLLFDSEGPGFEV